MIATGPGRDLVMYPRFRGYELWFYSAWAKETILMLDVDLLKLCPACQVWPWCAWCQKFLFPPDAHRSSPNHAKCKHWVEFFDHDWIKAECLRRM